MRENVLVVSVFILIGTLSTLESSAQGREDSIPEEFRIKREAIFEFTEKPTVVRQGDNYTIRFATKGFCDVTIAVETKNSSINSGQNNKIIRHLANGVLGPNAPEPFQKNSRKQTVVWDGKDDQGRYVDDKDACSVRVSLGLKPQLERTLYSHPNKRIGAKTPLVRACQEGVLVFDGQGVDHLRLFDHQGNYKRTIYPFSADEVEKLKSLHWHTFKQDGKKLPLKKGHVQATLLTSGTSSSPTDIFGNGMGATAMTIGPKGEIALAMNKVNRLHLTASGSDLPLEGPEVSQQVLLNRIHEFKGGIYGAYPRTMAFSPNGKYLYLGGYYWSYSWHHNGLNGVMRLEYGKNEPPILWKGVLTDKDKRKLNAESPEDLQYPSALAVDNKGRVYIADYFNDRIQVYAEDGKLLKSIRSFKPARIWLHPKTEEIYVASWILNGDEWRPYLKKKGKKSVPVPAVLRQMGTLDNPIEKVVYDLPFTSYGHYLHGVNFSGEAWGELGRLFDVELDFWAEEPTLWITPCSIQQKSVRQEQQAIKLYTINDGKLVLKQDTALQQAKHLPRLDPSPFSRQRMCVNPATGLFYVMDQDNGTDKNFSKVSEFDPQTGTSRVVELPCHAEDICFDINNRAYLRVDQGILRFDAKTWREIPWDYGEEHPSAMFKGTSGGRSIPATSVLKVPGHRSNPFWHLGGIDISATGHLVVTTYNGQKGRSMNNAYRKRHYKNDTVGKPYQPQLYPGRFRWGEIHVFDDHGTLIAEDAFPGVGHLDGVGIDKHDNIYVMAGATRVLNGKKYDNPENNHNVSETLIKVRPNRAKVLSKGKRVPVPLNKEAQPKRSPDLNGVLGAGGQAWVENAEWFYGGVGFAGSNQPAPSCCCWNSRFSLDLFARSFAPEIRHYSIAVLDSAGNLILRVGRYGNIDDGKPLVANKALGNPRSIGGDEVALFHAPFVATHTDRRLFIADPGNGRIVSVKLGYYAEEQVALKNVADTLVKQTD